MKIIVTGALGHIGSRLIRDLPVSFPTSEIVMIDNMSAKRYISLFELPDGCNYRFIEGDVLKLDLAEIFKDADLVIHLAAITDAAGSFEIKDLIEHHNFSATEKVANACIYSNCAMIHFSSTSVYGTQHELVSEECSIDELKPQSPYAETKMKEEDLLAKLAKNESLQYSLFRFGTICGVSKGMRFHTAVNKFCWQAALGQPLSVWRTALHQNRPYLTLTDAVNAIVFVIENKLFNSKIYNVLTDNFTVNDIVENIRKYINPVHINYVDAEIMNQLSYEVCNRKFIKEGFKYSGSISDSIRKTIDLLENAHHLDV